MIGSDLDGTVRSVREPFAWMRDYCSNGSIRCIGGVLAALTAKRINRYIDADVYVTGSPKGEEWATRLWLKLHGMSGDCKSIYSDGFRDRRLQKGGVVPSWPFKTKMINALGIDVFYEDEADVAKHLASGTKARIEIV